MFPQYEENDWYEPDIPAIKKLNMTQGLEVILVHGTYCGDCQYTMPLLRNILKMWPVKLTECHVTKEEKAIQNDHMGLMKKYNITKIPTIILLKDGNEVHRVVECPNETIEKDFANAV